MTGSTCPLPTAIRIHELLTPRCHAATFGAGGGRPGTTVQVQSLLFGSARGHRSGAAEWMPAAYERPGPGGRAGLRSAHGIPGRVRMLGGATRAQPEERAYLVNPRHTFQNRIWCTFFGAYVLSCPKCQGESQTLIQESMSLISTCTCDFFII